MRHRCASRKEMRSDIRGLEGLPLQMLIIMLVLAIGIPAVYSSMTHYEERSTIQRVESQVDFIEEKAKTLYTYGEGNADVIRVDLEGGLFRDVEYLEVGNRSFKNLIRWEVEGGHTGTHIMENDIPLVSEDEEPLRLGSGRHRLKMETVYGEPYEEGEEMLFIQISLL